LREPSRGRLPALVKSNAAIRSASGRRCIRARSTACPTRHGWRKILARPRHPQADPAEQERFKKRLRARWRRLWQADLPATKGPC
jgi:hypothetical protein